MSTLPIRLRLPVFLCGALALLISFCGNSTADEAADEKFIATEKTKLRKKVEILFRKGKGDHFAIAMIENTFHTDGMRTTIRNVVVNGKNMQDEVTEFRIGGAYFPVPAAEFKVIEGQDAAVDAVVDHMAKYIRPRPTKQIAGPKGKATESPPPTGDWQFIGRFADAAKAEAALTDAKVAFESMPKWKVDDKVQKKNDEFPKPPPKWPAFQGKLSGQIEVRIRNPNRSPVRVGLRSNGQGHDFVVPGETTKSASVPNGPYEIYFQFADKPDKVFQGDKFTLKDDGVEIQIVKVVNGNFSIREVE